MRLFILPLLVALASMAAGAWFAVGQRDWTPLAKLHGHGAGIVAVAISEDGTHGVSLDAAGELRWWNLKTHKPLGVVQLEANGALQVGQAVVAISSDGSVIAASSPAIGTLLWHADRPTADAVVAVNLAWAELLAISNQAELLATMDGMGNLQVWRTQTGVHVADYERNPHASPEQVILLRFSDQDLAVGFIFGDGFDHRFIDVETGSARYTSGGGNGGASRADPGGWRYAERDINIRIFEGSSLATTSFVAIDEVNCSFALRYRAPTHSVIYPLHSPTRDHSAAVHLDTDTALHGSAWAQLRIHRPAHGGDSLLHPAPYLTLLAAVALLIWIGYEVTHPDILPAIDVSLNALPLPWSLRIAGVLLIVVGVWGVLTMVLGDRQFINLTALLLLSGVGVLRRHQNGRGMSLFAVWLFWTMLAAIAGTAAAGGPLQYSLGGWHTPLPRHQALSISLTLLLVPGWFIWVLSNRRTRLIFQAAGYRDGLEHLRICPECSYDLRATVVHGGEACPECGKAVVYDAVKQATIRAEFEREMPS